MRFAQRFARDQRGREQAFQIVVDFRHSTTQRRKVLVLLHADAIDDLHARELALQEAYFVVAVGGDQHRHQVAGVVGEAMDRVDGICQRHDEHLAEPQHQAPQASSEPRVPSL